MMLNETYTLSNGVKIPKLGLGTWFIDDDKAGDTVKEAVKLGYRLIDTAQAYGNERGVGELQFIIMKKLLVKQSKKVVYQEMKFLLQVR